MNSAIRPDLAKLRLLTGIALRRFTQRYDGVPRTLLALACEKLVLTEAGVREVMNAPDVLTHDLQVTGRFDESTAYVFRALYKRPAGLSRTALLELCHSAVGGTADLDVALLPLLQVRVVRCHVFTVRGRRKRWYQVVRV